MWHTQYRTSFLLLVGALIGAVFVYLFLRSSKQTKIYTGTATQQQNALTFSDVAFIYHGAPVDKDFRVLALSRDQIDAIVQSMIQTLGTPRPAVELPDGTVRPLQQSVLDKQKFTNELKSLSAEGSDPLFAKIALAQQAAEKLSSSERSIYVERLAVLRQLLSAMPDVKKPAENTQLGQMLSAQAFQASPKLSAKASYTDDCKAAGVPIPPNWPDSAWKDRGVLPPKYTFASFDGAVTTEVFTYEPSDGGGLCYALPRKDGAGSIQAMGVICQAKQSGKACFFDNLDAAGKRITGTTIAMDFSKVQNGYVLQENCTECHRGFNAFMIHPATPLGAVKSRNPVTRYSPIGQASWSNPPGIADRDSGGACSDCHEIGAPNSAYCGFLKQAADKTMPNPNTPAGWVNPLDEFKADIAFLKSHCP